MTSLQSLFCPFFLSFHLLLYILLPVSFKAFFCLFYATEYPNRVRSVMIIEKNIFTAERRVKKAAKFDEKSVKLENT